MIAKISTGQGFGGLINYANDLEKKNTVIIASEGVSLTSNASITASFRVQAKALPTLQNFVGHISLSFSPDDAGKLNEKMMTEIARKYLQRMGIVNTQFVVFRHQDQPHPHVHIVYNRVNNYGEAIKGDTNYRKSVAITKALTREHGLTFGKDKKKVRRERLKGKDAIKYRLYDCIREAVDRGLPWNEIRKVLSVKGISLNFIGNKDSCVCGVTFTDTVHDVTFAGNQIDRSLSFANINRRIYGTKDVGASEGVFPDYCGTDSQGDTSTGSNMGRLLVDVLLPPDVAHAPSGGGTSSSGKWRDDDDDDDKKKNNRKFKR